MKTIINWTGVLAVVFLLGPYFRQPSSQISTDILPLNFIGDYDLHISIILTIIHLACRALASHKNGVLPFTDDSSQKPTHRNNTNVLSNNNFHIESLFSFKSSRKERRTLKKKVRRTKNK